MVEEGNIPTRQGFQATIQAEGRRYKFSGTKQLKPPGGNWGFPTLVPKHTKREVWPALDHKGFGGGGCLFVCLLRSNREGGDVGASQQRLGVRGGYGELALTGRFGLLSLHPTKVPSFLCLRIDPGKGAKEEL